MLHLNSEQVLGSIQKKALDYFWYSKISVYIKNKLLRKFFNKNDP